MAGNLKWYGTLANETVKEITKDAENWKKYLHMASRLYRYHFSDQLLIYAQNPKKGDDDRTAEAGGNEGGV